MKKFKQLGMGKDLINAVETLGFEEPTEVQMKAIPLALKGKDVIGESATGSGKTLAFSAPIIEKVKPREGIQSLILTPTRELAKQVSDAIESFSTGKNRLNVVTVYGGVSIENQIRDLRNSEVVVGTPGRLLDHISRKTIDLSKVKILILDEADRMFDMGFIDDVADIINQCPEKGRQTLLFSATISSDVGKIAKRYMKDPIQVTAEPQVDPSKLKQVFYDVPQHQKFSLLVHLLQEEKSKLVMIFCNTKRNADLITANLKRHDFDAMALHGNLSQNKREKVLKHFHKSERFILVCTDVAARGLDIQGVSHVYNYDFPKTRDDYTHRIGRTARAGKDGKAINILTPRDYQTFRRSTRYLETEIEQIPVPKFKDVFFSTKIGGRDGRSSGRRGHSSRGRSSGGRRYQSKGKPRKFSGKPRYGRSSSRGRSSGGRSIKAKPGEARRFSGGDQRRHHKSRSSNPQGRKRRSTKRQNSGRK
ncbi:MAG: DEAD/DEAH box helicase [Candidatus Pacearchaeota archaeon]